MTGGWSGNAAKLDATVVVRSGADPLLVVSGVGAGRAVAFASDPAPHCAPPEFVGWSCYPLLWTSILSWAAGRQQ